ncbi:lasso peptide biosynthesis protein [Flavimaricola marinus]
MRLGARKDPEGRLAAHAWLLHDGKVLIGGTEDTYQEFG